MASTPLLTHFAHAYIVKSTVLMKSLRLIAPHYPNKEKNNLCRNVYIGMNSDRIIETTSINQMRVYDNNESSPSPSNF